MDSLQPQISHICYKQREKSGLVGVLEKKRKGKMCDFP